MKFQKTQFLVFFVLSLVVIVYLPRLELVFSIIPKLWEYNWVIMILIGIILILISLVFLLVLKVRKLKKKLLNQEIELLATQQALEESNFLNSEILGSQETLSVSGFANPTVGVPLDFYRNNFL